MIHFDFCWYVLSYYFSHWCLYYLWWQLILTGWWYSFTQTVKKGDIEVLRLLLDRDANIEAVGNVSQNVSVASTYVLHSIILCIVLYYVMMLLYYVWSRSSYLYYYSGYDGSADWQLLSLLIWLMLSSWPWLSWLWWAISVLLSGISL